MDALIFEDREVAFRGFFEHHLMKWDICKVCKWSSRCGQIVKH